MYETPLKNGCPHPSGQGARTERRVLCLGAKGLDGPLLGGSDHVWAAVLALALLSTAFAYLLYFTIVARAGATNASLVTLIVPVSAILLGALFLDERLELLAVVRGLEARVKAPPACEP